MIERRTEMERFIDKSMTLLIWWVVLMLARELAWRLV